MKKLILNLTSLFLVSGLFISCGDTKKSTSKTDYSTIKVQEKSNKQNEDFKTVKDEFNKYQRQIAKDFNMVSDAITVNIDGESLDLVSKALDFLEESSNEAKDYMDKFKNSFNGKEGEFIEIAVSHINFMNLIALEIKDSNGKVTETAIDYMNKASESIQKLTNNFD